MKQKICVALILIGYCSFSQLSGVINVPTTYTSISAVVSALNQQGVSGSLTVSIASGYTETAPVGGYSLTASGSSVNSILFIKNGSGPNPLISAYSGGSGTPGSMLQDGIWRLIGSDYVTIDGLDIMDVNTSNPETMEFGYGLFKADATNGCTHVTIKNCHITLKRINNSTGSGPASDGSRGIDVVNATSNVHNSAISVNAISGAHSYNKFYSNTIQNCNIGISLIGFADVAPFSYADVGNDVGGSSTGTGNAIIDFGGGGTLNPALAIRTQSQYDLNVSFNTINNNTGQGIDHSTTLRGIQLNSSVSANATVLNNTITLHGGGTNSQLSVIENSSGSTPANNTITISNNLVTNCTYTTASSGSFYGIWNNASSSNLSISSNTFLNNSTGAGSGSTYLIYNSGAVADEINISGNKLGFTYQGFQAYTGTLYSIYNSSGTSSTELVLNNNTFSNYNYLNNTGTGNLYFIYNTNDSYNVTINANVWNSLNLNHSGSEYLICNSSSTQSLLTVNNNSITTSYVRSAATGPMYLYYSNGSSPATCSQIFNGNNFSHITSSVTGTGLFYGMYNSDGAGAPYPKKAVSNNILSDIVANGTGTFYGFYLDNMGDASSMTGSSVYGNTITSVSRSGPLYGIYLAATSSPSIPAQVYSNHLTNFNSAGTAAYGAYLSGGAAGINFYKNKISEVVSTGTNSTVYGAYLTNAVNINFQNNFIGNLSTPNSSATNALNGIYINSGTLVAVYYNTVYLSGASAGVSFNSNAIYAATTTSLILRNNIFVNTYIAGTGVSAAFRRSSTNLTTYSSLSNNNLFYAGTPGPNNVILQSGATGYQSLTALQTAVAPRDAQSISVLPAFMSTLSTSQNYLHITPNIASLIESSGINLSGITDDYDAQIRQGNPGYNGTGSAPDMGADEFNQNLVPCTTASAGVISPFTYSICAGQTISLISNNYTPGTGLQHQWKFSTSAGGTYSNVTGGIGANTPEYFSAALPAGTYYFIMTSTCTNNAVSASSNEATVVVNAIPFVAVSAQNTLVCAGQTLALFANSSPGSVYNWLGPSGFNSTLQNPILTGVTNNASGLYYVSASLNDCLSPPVSVSISISTVTLSVTATQQTICMGSTSTISLSTSANSYSWSNASTNASISVSPTMSTIYSVLVTNSANCSATASINIGVVNPTITANSTLICGSSSNLTLSVSAFTPSTVFWYSAPTSTQVIHTGITYSVAVPTTTTFYVVASHPTINCASQRIPVTVTVSAYPSLSLVASPATVCPGKTASLTVSGAQTYSWSGIGTGSMVVVVPSGNQTFTVKGTSALGCSSNSTIAVNMFTIALVSITPSLVSVCPSSVLGFTANGALTYTWNTGTNGPVNTVTPAVNTTYTVFGSNLQGCISSKTVAVTTRSVPLITILQSADSICPVEPVNFKASGASSYTWLPGFAIGNTFTAQPVVTSVFNVIGKSVNSCTNIAFANVFVKPCTDIMDANRIAEINIYPIPAAANIKLEIGLSGSKEFVIQNSSGSEFLKEEFNEYYKELDISSFNPGIYFLKLKFNKRFYFLKFIKE